MEDLPPGIDDISLVSYVLAGDGVMIDPKYRLKDFKAPWVKRFAKLHFGMNCKSSTKSTVIKNIVTEMERNEGVHGRLSVPNILVPGSPPAVSHKTGDIEGDVHYASASTVKDVQTPKSPSPVNDGDHDADDSICVTTICQV